MIKKMSFMDFSPSERVAFEDESRSRRLVTLGRRSYFVQGMMEYGSADCHILIGRYSSLGHRLVFEIDLNHDHSCISTYPFEDKLQHADDILHYDKRCSRRQIIVGNDVWMGCDVLLVGGVRIGNGAVLGAGAVVAKDVPPYAVVVGNPARIIKYRFSEDIIGKLQKIKWWNWPDEKVVSVLPQVKDVQAFADTFIEEVEPETAETDVSASLKELHAQGYTIYYCIADFDIPDPVWQSVLETYLHAYRAQDKVALLFGIGSSCETDQALLHMRSRVEAMGEKAPLVLTHSTEEKVCVPVLRQAECLITTKDGISSEAVDYAADAGIRIVYGLDDRGIVFPK